MCLGFPPDLEGDEGGVSVGYVVQLPADLPAHGHLVIQTQTVHTTGP